MRVARCTYTHKEVALSIQVKQLLLNNAKKFIILALAKALPKIWEYMVKKFPTKEIKYKAMVEIAENTLSRVDLKDVAETLATSIRKFGVKLGIIYGFWEIFEKDFLPDILARYGLPPFKLTEKEIPWGESFIFPIALKVLKITG
jgi:hypothetical protein